MQFQFDEFLKICVEKLGIKIISPASCPIHQNPLCLRFSNDCEQGKNNDCYQRFKFFMGKAPYSFEVIFYGKDRRGYINTDSLSITNFIRKYPDEFKELVPKKSSS